MTLVSEIITDAYRQSNLLAIGTTPTAEQQTEALRYLNRIVKSVFGNEAGDPLTAFPLGGDNISRPSGYPWWGNQPDNDWFVPKNIRVMCNLTQTINLYLHPDPDNGSRFAVQDVSENFSSYNVNVHGNGRLIEGAFNTVLTADGTNKEWFYRDDIGSWVLLSPVSLSDTFPFPEEFDFFFIIQLAIAVNPAYDAELNTQTQLTYQRALKQLRARYAQHIPVRSELGLIRMPRVAADRDLWGNSYWLYNPNSMFDKGWPW